MPRPCFFTASAPRWNRPLAIGAQCCANDSGVLVKKGDKSVGAEPCFEFMPAEEDSTAGSFPPDCVVQVTIIGAQGLDSGDWREGQGPRDPYCTCEIQGKPQSSVSTPPSCDGMRDPTWNFQVMIPSYAFPDALVFTVFDADFHDYNSHLGKAQVSASKLKACEGKFEGQLMLAGISGSKSAPLLHVRIEAVPRPAKVEHSEAAARDPAELPRGRLVRLNIHKGPDRKLGLLLHKSLKEEVIVLEVSPDGAAGEYNRGAKVREQLQVGDRIMEVNGLKDTDEFVEELGPSEDLELLVECRSHIFKVVMDKPEDTLLGIDISFKDDGELLCVSAIAEGAVQSYNKTAPVEKQVRLGDHILSVNGVRDPKQRLGELQRGSGPTELLLRRISGLPSEAFVDVATLPKKKKKKKKKKRKKKK